MSGTTSLVRQHLFTILVVPVSTHSPICAEGLQGGRLGASF
jgi:hypothetical protein